MESRILVVDDEKFIVEAIAQHLKQSGYAVATFIDPVKAKEVIETEDFDLVLTDLRMPHVSGMDITRAVHKRNKDTLVIILTGYATLDSAIESVHLQVYAYLNKPFDLRQLGQVVERALTEQRLKRENEILQARIAKMLNDVTTLHKVSQLLYDTDDWDMTLEFVLDTLSIGLVLTHSCLLFKDERKGYRLGKGNFPDKSPLGKTISNYSWKNLEAIVSTEKPTSLKVGGETPKMIQELSSRREPLHGIFFTPIRYRENLLGFLVVFCVDNTECITEDQQTLLEILATQIAPQMFQSDERRADQASADLSLANVQASLRREIDALGVDGEVVGINLLRFITPRVLRSQAEVDAFHKACTQLVLKHDSHAKLQWLMADTAFMILPRSNRVQAEITCMALSEDYQKSEIIDAKIEGVAKLLFASAAWPEDAAGTAELIMVVCSRLMHQMHEDVFKRLATKSVNA